MINIVKADRHYKETKMQKSETSENGMADERRG